MQNKKEMLNLLNQIIDSLILTNQTHTKQYKQLTKLHKIIIKELNIIN